MGDSGMDISLEEQRLNDLKNEINAELIAVRGILRNVANECDSDPSEDDTILVEIQKVGNDMRSAWGNLCDAFQSVTNKITDILSGYNKTATTHSENAGNISRSL